MLGNGIKQTTATTGTGALTLSAVTGYPTLADVFALNQPFSYTLLDSAGLFIEAGVGYLSSSTVMVRAKVSATFISAAYVNQGATAASLTGTTTVICTPNAGSMLSGFQNVDAQSASVLRYLSTASRNCNFGTLALTANRCTYTVFELKTAVVLSALLFNVTVAGAGGTTARMALYACNEKGYMGSILAGNTVAHDTSSTGTKTETLATPLFLPAGWYFTAIACSGTPTISSYTSGASNVIGGGPGGFVVFGASVDYRFENLSGGFSSLPDPANTTTTAQATGSFGQPLVQLGVT